MQVTAFYQFAKLPDFAQRVEALMALGAENGLKGTLLYAELEGVNGMFCGAPEALDVLLAWLRSVPGLEQLEEKRSPAPKQLFKHFKVKKRKEIVSLGHPDGDPLKQVGQYVEPENWNALISDPQTLTIDVRNDYEVAIGSFKNALNPHTKTFREFPKYVEERLLEYKDRPIAMLCTGGIRCEKSTSYLLAKGFKHVYHLKGGILNYFQKVPPQESLWQGDCFVFDHRVTLGHTLQPGERQLCHACRQPLEDHELKSPQYEPGVSCPHCHANTSESRKVAFRQRHKALRAKGDLSPLGSPTGSDFIKCDAF